MASLAGGDSGILYVLGLVIRRLCEVSFTLTSPETQAAHSSRILGKAATKKGSAGRPLSCEAKEVQRPRT